MNKKALIEQFVDGWRKGDEREILDALSEDCLIIESHGPLYRGKKMVKEWIADWYGQGNIVEKWKITSFYSFGDRVVFERVFAWKGKNLREAFEGITIAKVNEKIVELREYRATAFPFMWQPKDH